MKGVAFAPGHISAFFEPKYVNQSLDRTGSRGAGMCISLGATTRVKVYSSTNLALTVQVNGAPSDAPVTKSALKYLVDGTPLNIQVDTVLDLPESQGFGMSASGALSATLAASDILGLSRDDAVRAAHYAEIELRTGLGDVVASSFGGIEIRREAGLPPWGVLEHIPGDLDIVLCVIGEKMLTRKVLTDTAMLETITSYGRYCTKQLLEKPTVERLFSLGWEFTQKSGLAEPMVITAIEAANRYGKASMCMLGNSVYAMGNTDRLKRTLEAFGNVWVCRIDQVGARLIRE
jgi:pantoate kinase